MRESYKLKLAGGDALDLRYTFRSIRYYEKETGGHFFGDFAGGKIGGEFLTVGIAAGLLHKNAEIKPSQIETMIERHLEMGGNLPDLVEKVVEALQASGVLKRVGVDRPTEDAAQGVG